ncbi:alpha/beta hydrolase [Hellea sp.]|nr:alpha/beta hydrolase [Hellea sp.]
MSYRYLFGAASACIILASCGKAAESAPPATDAVTEVASSAISEREISSGDLKGMLIDAGDDSPIILIVPGSGPTDLDGNNPMGVNANSYKLLAEGLEEKGVSTIRVDKRGMFSSEAAGDPNAVTLDIYAQDYRDWADTVTSKTGRECIYLLGHSEGGMMVSAAAIDNEKVCGLILVAAPGRPFGTILREQLKANPANTIVMKPALKAIDTLEAGERVDTETMHPALKPLFYPQVQGFLISVMAKDPAQLAKEASKPTLIVQGSHDIQVSETDANLLAKATGGKLVVIDGMNHVLKDAPANRIRNMMTYKNPDLPIAPELIESISEFVLRN